MSPNPSVYSFSRNVLLLLLENHLFSPSGSAFPILDFSFKAKVVRTKVGILSHRLCLINLVSRRGG